jgi:hypothetical protein
MWAMEQTSLGFDTLSRKARKEVFLDEMSHVVPWSELAALITKRGQADLP